MNVTITPKRSLSGEITAPPSKAHTHRAMFAGLLSRGVTKILNPLSCDDTEASANAVSCLGGRVKKQAKAWLVQSDGNPTAFAREIYCGESGVTLRFTIPVASLTGARIMFTGNERLMRRPIEPLADAMSQLAVKVSSDKKGVNIEGGPPKGGKVRIRGDVSSQFISGLLLAAPLMEEGLQLNLTSPLESRTYVSLTIRTMEHHGIAVKKDTDMSVFEVTKQSYRPATHQVPGDYSSATFAMCASAITDSKLLIRGLPQTNSEPDSVVVEILSKMGAVIRSMPEGLLLEGRQLKAIDADLSNCPDLGPALAVLGCFAHGQTRITGARRLRYKESDRLNTVATELRALGADIEETEDGLIARGPCPLKAGVVRSHGDHRIAMALSVAAIGARDSVVIQGAECVSKSYPDFFRDLSSIGVEVIGG